MMKKLILAVVVLVLVAGGFFYWRQNQADVRELNKTLPEGVKIVKSLVGNEYGVVNKIDGYEFKIPPEMIKLKEIKYYEEEDANGISLENIDEKFLGFGAYKLDATDVNLESWVDSWMSKFKTFSWTKEKESIGNFEVIILLGKDYLSGEVDSFFKKSSRIYSISGESRDFIRYIIANGKW